MGSHMKTTVDISDDLLRRAKKLARDQETTLRSLIEAGLRHVLSSQRPRRRFKLKDASYRGKGLRPEFQGAPWAAMRDEIYEDRGA